MEGPLRNGPLASEEDEEKGERQTTLGEGQGSHLPRGRSDPEGGHTPHKARGAGDSSRRAHLLTGFAAPPEILDTRPGAYRSGWFRSWLPVRGYEHLGPENSLLGAVCAGEDAEHGPCQRPQHPKLGQPQCAQSLQVLGCGEGLVHRGSWKAREGEAG